MTRTIKYRVTALSDKHFLGSARAPIIYLNDAGDYIHVPTGTIVEMKTYGRPRIERLPDDTSNARD